METQLKYVETPHCRMNTLVEYFGEKRLKPCGICDICLSKKEKSPEINTQIDQLDSIIKSSDEDNSELINIPSLSFIDKVEILKVKFM